MALSVLSKGSRRREDESHNLGLWLAFDSAGLCGWHGGWRLCNRSLFQRVCMIDHVCLQFGRHDFWVTLVHDMSCHIGEI
jgi:hypothetical protein